MPEPTITLAGLMFRVGADGRPIIPPLCGGDDGPPKDPSADPPADPPKTPPVTGEFTAADKAALDAALASERTLRKQHEKDAKDLKARLQKLEDADASELDREKKRADEAEARITAATEKARRANLLTALIGAGVPKAKAAARLLDGVEYDDDTDEPTNLDAALATAKTEYGDDMFKAAKPTAPDLNGGGGNGDITPPNLSADELAMAKSFQMTPAEYQQFKSPQPTPAAAK